jgi:hypothetical protein
MHPDILRPARLLLVAALAVLTVTAVATDPRPAAAQSCSNCGPNTPGPAEGAGPAATHLGTLSKANTRDFVLYLQGIDDTCGRRIDPRYRIDCLRATYVRLANQIPATGDYAPVRDALFAAARKLDAIVKANLDPDLPTIRPRLLGQGGGHRIQPIRAVAKDRLKTANAEAAKVVKDTSLLILRSGDRPPRRTVHYQQVAAAVDDNLILLRSG